MPAELDLFGGAAPPCDAGVPVPGPIADLVGSSAAPVVQTIAAEWCAPLAWPVAWAEAWQEHGHRVVHAWHDLQLHRPLPPRFLLSAEVVAQRPTRAGALTVVRYDAATEDGPVWTSFAGALWRGLGTAVRGGVEQPEVAGCDGGGVALDVPADLALRYSEVSGIRNPIHTDVAAARAAGLPAPVLHGSATLALALGALGRTVAPERLQVRFLAPVVPPDRLEVATTADPVDRDILAAEVRRSDGTTVLRLRARYRPSSATERKETT